MKDKKIAKEPTPLMQQYQEVKLKYPDMLIFFQVGDFYELFFEDAQKAAAFLGITLTKRGNHNGEPIPLCGVPVHTVDHYLQKLVKGGFCVVVVDQLESATPGKMVKRGVTQVLTPGTLTNATMLDAKSASYLCSCVVFDNEWALVFAEMLTLQWYVTSIPAGAIAVLETELARFFPDEIIFKNSGSESNFSKEYFAKQGYYTTECADEVDIQFIKEKLTEVVYAQLHAQRAAHAAVGLLYDYLKRHNNPAIDAVIQMHFYQPHDFLLLDQATQKNLELITNSYNGTTEKTLFSVIDKATTSMGSRVLKKWLVRPLLSQHMIDQRLDAVDFLKNHYQLLQHIQEILSQVGDIERSFGRIMLGRGAVHDYVHLKKVLQLIPSLQQKLLSTVQLPSLLITLAQTFGNFSVLQDLFAKALYEGQENWIIKEGFNERLDQLRGLISNRKTALFALEKQEQESTGINSLKVRYTAAHGYYIEITNTHAHLVPAHYKRHQTLVGRERFTCSSLQDLQHEILTADEHVIECEQALYMELKAAVMGYYPALRRAIYGLCQLDGLAAFALCAAHYNYVRPTWSKESEDREIVLQQSRHPVVERAVGSLFVANDLTLHKNTNCWLLTGPNMGGKSTFLRQVALIQIMAQCGSFVPAQFVRLSIVDRIFTRIGASDNVAQGKSTFLVEMEETAAICQYATEKSLVILDEVGRGTSTQDGVALAQAVVEYIVNHIKAFCLFATHYHELSSLKDTFSTIANYHAATMYQEGRMIFLHKIIPGVAEGSFGIEAAKIAHMPKDVIQRAEQLIMRYDSNNEKNNLKHSFLVSDNPNNLLMDELEQLRNLKKMVHQLPCETMTPLQALELLWKLQNFL